MGSLVQIQAGYLPSLATSISLLICPVSSVGPDTKQAVRGSTSVRMSVAMGDERGRLKRIERGECLIFCV